MVKQFVDGVADVVASQSARMTPLVACAGCGSVGVDLVGDSDREQIDGD